MGCMMEHLAGNLAILGVFGCLVGAFLAWSHYDLKGQERQLEADIERWNSWVPDDVQEGTLPPLDLYPDDEEED